MPRDELARDTIAAIATPPGRGGIGIVRLSGPQVRGIARKLLGRLPEPRRAVHARFLDIDDGVALYFAAPHSYTGEDVLELQGHGGPVVLQALLGACLDAGARLAEPGEYTRRAYLEGKLDLAQAEAVADLIDAASREAARAALRSLGGEFSAAVRTLVAQLTALRALVEATLDFPEEDVDRLHREDAEARLAAARAALEDVLGRSRQGSLLRSGIHVVLAGRPNVGKSSLLNRLAGEERAIVTAQPGTTRDALHQPIQIAGVPLIVVDTAGLRETTDEVERLGVERTRHELARADVVLEVLDASQPESADGARLPKAAERIVVCNKIDLRPEFVPPAGAVAVSAKTGEGIERLRQTILVAAGWSSTGETTFLARERHLRALGLARSHLGAAAGLLARPELFAEELRLAQEALAAITGEVTADDLLGEIFARFCIGK